MKIEEFTFERVLSCNDKTAAILLSSSNYNSPNNLSEELNDNRDKKFAVALIEKTTLKLPRINEIFKTGLFHSELSESNDRYHQLAGFVDQTRDSINQFSVTFIYPATEKDIEKYSEKTLVLFRETGNEYQNITLPYVESHLCAPERTQWIYNILDHKSETDSIVYEDQVCLLIPNLRAKQNESISNQNENNKTDNNNNNNILNNENENENENNNLSPKTKNISTSLIQYFALYKLSYKDYFQSINNDFEESFSNLFNQAQEESTLKSLRDLRRYHLPLLKHIKSVGIKTISEIHNVRKDQIRAFIHYLPSYWHLHIHFCHVDSDLGGSFAATRAHLVDDVIQNLELCSNYYQDYSLTYQLDCNDRLYELLSSERNQN